MHRKATPKKYEHIDFKPPQGVADAAEKGLEYRAKANPSQRGGLTPAEAAEEGVGSGVQRAVNLKNRNNISPDVIRQMSGFFARHEQNKGVADQHRGKPWNDKGHVSWLLWGGDPGKSWVAKVIKQMDAADQQAKEAMARTVAALHSASRRKKAVHNDVGLFIRLPDHLGKLFPHKDEDPSPPHCTLLIVGTSPKERKEELLRIVKRELAIVPSPLKARFGQLDYFVNPLSDTRVAHCPVTFSQDVAEIRDRIWWNLEGAGFDIVDAYPMAYRPHITLGYLKGAHDAVWSAPVPKGQWDIKEIEVWGFGDPIPVKLGTDTAPNTLLKKLRSR